MENEVEVKLLERSELENSLHFSHLYHYVSAYEVCSERLEHFKESISVALRVAKETRIPQIVDEDGEMFLLVTPAGYVSLCLRWKTYRVKN